MTSDLLTFASDKDRFEFSGDEWQAPEETYRIHILTTCDEDGVFSTVALNLPGAGSCGATPEEAIENAKEAIKGVIESYKEAGDPIPWKDSTAENITTGEQKWIIVRG